MWILDKCEIRNDFESIICKKSTVFWAKEPTTVWKENLEVSRCFLMRLLGISILKKIP